MITDITISTCDERLSCKTTVDVFVKTSRSPKAKWHLSATYQCDNVHILEHENGKGATVFLRCEGVQYNIGVIAADEIDDRRPVEAPAQVA